MIESPRAICFCLSDPQKSRFEDRIYLPSSDTVLWEGSRVEVYWEETSGPLRTSVRSWWNLLKPHARRVSLKTPFFFSVLRWKVNRGKSVAKT